MKYLAPTHPSNLRKQLTRTFVQKHTLANHSQQFITQRAVKTSAFLKNYTVFVSLTEKVDIFKSNFLHNLPLHGSSFVERMRTRPLPQCLAWLLQKQKRQEACRQTRSSVSLLPNKKISQGTLQHLLY